MTLTEVIWLNLSPSTTLANAGGNVDGVGGDTPLPEDVGHLRKFFGKNRLPNILLIIADDIGIDVTTGMYPDLLDDIYDLYINHDPDPHPNAGDIYGNPASTPVLNNLASEGYSFFPVHGLSRSVLPHVVQ